jgi:hypothetical protein
MVQPHQPKRSTGQMRVSTLAIAIGLSLAMSSVVAVAQSTTSQAAGSLTRAEAKADRDAFMKSHHWDEMNESWLSNAGEQEPPVSALTRAEAKSSRDDFLSKNRWKSEVGWVPIQPQPRVMSSLTRQEVRAETQEFMRTHRYDQVSATWKMRQMSMMR